MTNLVNFKIETGVQGKFIERTVEKGSIEWVELFTVQEVKRVAKKEAMRNNFRFDPQDLEDYVAVRVWEKVSTKENYQTVAGIRQHIKRFVINFLNSPTNVNVTSVKTGLVVDYTNGESITIEEANSRGLDLSACAKEYTTNHDVANFSSLSTSDDEGSETDFEGTFVSSSQPAVSSLAVDNSMLAEFVSTILNDRQRSILELIVAGYEVNEIASILGIHRNTIRNTMKTIKELALDFGLEEI